LDMLSTRTRTNSKWDASDGLDMLSTRTRTIPVGTAPGDQGH
jgi:hypothetical protein